MLGFKIIVFNSLIHIFIIFMCQGLFFDESYGFYQGQVLIGPAKVFSNVQWLYGVKPVLSKKSKFRVVVEEVGDVWTPAQLYRVLMWIEFHVHLRGGTLQKTVNTMAFICQSYTCYILIVKFAYTNSLFSSFICGVPFWWKCFFFFFRYVIDTI